MFGISWSQLEVVLRERKNYQKNEGRKERNKSGTKRRNKRKKIRNDLEENKTHILLKN
jgi:hypothetical protein